MVTERQEEPQKGVRKGAALTAVVRRTVNFRGFLEKSELERGSWIVRNWTVHAPWTVACRWHSDRSGLQNFLNISGTWESSK
jgi:hypothetical protein